MTLRRAMTSRSGKICAAWLLGQLMFEMELKDTGPDLAACRSVLNVLASRISRARGGIFSGSCPGPTASSFSRTARGTR